MGMEVRDLREGAEIDVGVRDGIDSKMHLIVRPHIRHILMSVRSRSGSMTGSEKLQVRM